MPNLINVSKIDFEHTLSQKDLKPYARNLFAEVFKEVDKLIDVFDNTQIKTRNFCVPVEFFLENKSFEEKNNIYIQTALDKSIEAIEKCLYESGIEKSRITDLVFISTTGLATPSLDALIINKMRLSPYINRTPIWGLGCAGGVSGMAKAFTAAKANPEAIILIVAVELCSLTFIRNDLSKSNFVATSLFSDGVSAGIIAGDEALKEIKTKHKISYVSSQSRLYYDALDVMGWDFVPSGFKVVFSKDIPTIVNKSVKEDVERFLEKNNLKISDIKNFIFHPGGAKVIDAYTEALGLERGDLGFTRDVLENFGNMSSVTVFYVMEKFIREGFKNGFGLMLSLGPGFSSEMVLLDMRES